MTTIASDQADYYTGVAVEEKSRLIILRIALIKLRAPSVLEHCKAAACERPIEFGPTGNQIYSASNGTVHPSGMTKTPSLGKKSRAHGWGLATTCSHSKSDVRHSLSPLLFLSSTARALYPTPLVKTDNGEATRSSAIDAMIPHRC